MKDITLEHFMNDFKESVMMFFIESESFENYPLFFNDACKDLLRCTDCDALRGLTLEQLFGMTQVELRRFIHEKIEGQHLNENRIIFIYENESELFNISYNLLSSEKGLLIQFYIKNVEESDFFVDLLRTEDNISKVNYDKSYIALLAIKNHESILKSYGPNMVVRIKKMIREELRRSFNQLTIYTGDRTYLIAIADELEDVVSDFRSCISKLNKHIFDGGLNVICEIKVGISSYVTNPFNGLKEAKYSLNEIFNKRGEVADYVLPTDALMMEYVIKNDLPYAIEKEELSVVFQGIYNIQESFLYGFEVLVRWHHSKYGAISPATFIPLAEKTNLVTELDLWVVEEALGVYDQLDMPDKDRMKVNFNISPKDFFEPNFVDRFINLVEKSSIRFENVIVELTETLDLYPERSSLQKIKNKGVLIALDDFGTGFASLSQIKNYQIDFLKIDISFTRDINKNYDNTLITNAILALANNLNISVIAEGVEDNEQIRFLKSRKCEYVQGFKLHKPVYAKELKEQFAKTEVDRDYELLPYGDLSYKDYVGFYEYGKLIYLSVDHEGQIVDNSDLLIKTLNYEIRNGEYIQSIVINGLSDSFTNHLNEVSTVGNHKSFMTELVGLKESIPVKTIMMPSQDSQMIDIFFEDYSDRREHYNKVKNVYNRYDLIFQKVKSAIIVSDKEMIVQEWNNHAEEIFGYTAKEAIGKNLIKLLVAKDKQGAIDVIANRTLMGEITSNVNENIRKDGQVIICQWESSNLVNEEEEIIGSINWILDITEQLKLQEELNYLSTVVKQEPVPIVITDTRGDIEFINEAFSDVTGYTADEVIGENPNILSSGTQSVAFYKDLWKTILSGQVWEGQIRNKKKDNTIYITDSRIFPIKNDKGIITRFCCIQKDVTKEIEQDDKIREINVTLENQERLSMIGQMAAGIMHEINNPLSYIDMNVHALSGLADHIGHTEENKETIQELKEIGEDLKEGIDNIKNIAAGLKRFTYQSEGNAFEDVDLNDEIQTIATVSKNEYKYYCELIIEAGQISYVHVDPGKIKQVLLNLIINAVHAIKDKEGDWGQINIRTYEEGDYVCCEVKDNGDGIPDEVQDKIFESFFTTKAEGVGTGLGLSLSKKIIEVDHEGHLTFESIVGQGTTFLIQLKKH